VYRTLKRREPTQRELLNVVRWSSLLCGALMLIIAWLFRNSGSAVKINNIVVSILDMPLFVITVVYGLTWRRMNWQGALAGFLGGGLASGFCYYRFSMDYARQVAPIVSSATALVITPIVALLTPANTEGRAERLLESIGRGDENEGDVRPFHLFPESGIGKSSALAVVGGFVIFVVGVLSAPLGSALASTLAVTGLILVMLAGTVRAYSN
jgi:hypothetical protein